MADQVAVKFNQNFDWKPNPSSTQRFPAGVFVVPKAVADAAIAQGKAELVKTGAATTKKRTASKA